MIEIIVKVSNEDSKLTKNFIVYDENIVLSKEDPILLKTVQSVIDSFKEDVQDVFVTIKMSW